MTQNQFQFDLIDFEKADTNGDTDYFDRAKEDGKFNDMYCHYTMTKEVFGEYETYPTWLKKQNSGDLPDLEGVRKWSRSLLNKILLKRKFNALKENLSES